MIASQTMTAPDHRRVESAAAPARMSAARIVRTRQDIDALAERWQALEKCSVGATPFQSLAWADAIFGFEAARGNKQFDPVIAILEQGDRLIAVLPLERISTPARRVLEPLGNGFAQYADMLLAPGTQPRSALKQLLQAAIKAAPCDAISLLKVREGSPLALGMPVSAIETGSEAGAPNVALNEFPDYATYFATVRTKTRKNMRNARNRLERDGPVEHRIVTDRQAQLDLIERTLSGRAERLREQGLTSRAFSDGDFPAFCKSLAGRHNIGLKTFSLTHNGRPIAEQWGFVHGGRYYAYVAARDFSQTDESPGKLHLSEIIRTCAEDGLIGCDLGVPVMPYKLTFATHTIPVRDFALPVTPKGWAITQFWDVMLRPTLKAVMLKTPPALRSRLMALLGRA